MSLIGCWNQGSNKARLLKNFNMVQARKESTLEKKDKTFLMKDHDSLSGKMFKSFPSQRVQRCEYKQSHINQLKRVILGIARNLFSGLHVRQTSIRSLL